MAREPNDPRAEPRSYGKIWCEDGQPMGRFEDSAAAPVEGPIPLPVWESLSRVLHATSSCVAFEGVAVRVTRNGVVSCEAPRFEIRDLIDRARVLARRGPPADPPSEQDGLQDICYVDPGACPPVAPAPQACPPFEGDIWSGLKRRPVAPPVIDLGAEDRFDDSGDAPTDADVDLSTPTQGSRPPQGVMTRAILVVLPAARECVTGFSEPSRVRLSLRSNGKVEGVRVEGAASGKPAADCIARAFAGVRVPPFDGPSFEIAVTVRGS